MTASPPERRRSRTAWPGPTTLAGVDEGHTHELPTALRRMFKVAVLGVVALTVAVAALAYFVYQQQQYIAGRGEYRDREVARLEEQIRRSICDLLDQLPEGGLLERPRAKYECGPGIPLDSLPPDEANRIREQRGENPAQLDSDHVYVPPTEPVDPMGGATAEDPYGAPTYGPPTRGADHP